MFHLTPALTQIFNEDSNVEDKVIVTLLTAEETNNQSLPDVNYTGSLHICFSNSSLYQVKYFVF